MNTYLFMVRRMQAFKKGSKEELEFKKKRAEQNEKERKKAEKERKKN